MRLFNRYLYEALEFRYLQVRYELASWFERGHFDGLAELTRGSHYRIYE